MGYATDVRQMYEQLIRGCGGDFGDSGVPLNAGEEVTVVALRNLAGKVYNVRLVSRSPYAALGVNLDGINVIGGWRDGPIWFHGSYECAGRFNLVHLARYDTVNEKYIYELVVPMEFGASIEIKLKNLGGVSARAFCAVNWIENA